MKKLLLFLLMILLPIVAKADYSGTCGTNVTYTYVESTQTLTISGSGVMNDYANSIEQPWGYYRDEILKIVIEDGVTNIGSHAFDYCKGPTSIVIPNSVKEIGQRAFQYCNGLKSITIGNSVTTIGFWAFNGCTALASIIVSTENSMFDSRENCNAIIETTTNKFIIGCKNSFIPNSVTTIGEYAFYGRGGGLTSIEIPNSVTTISNNAFEGCGDLKSITLGNNVTNIGESAFFSCSNLTSITIPSNVTSIGAMAFMSCSGLTSIIIENGVTSIGGGAFTYCSGLTSITIPGSVANIGNLFSGCNKLSNVVLSEGVQAVLARAFEGCMNLNSITLPSTILSIGLNAIPSTAIKDVYCYATSVEATNKGAFSAAISNATLHIPASAIEYYSSTEPWSRFGKIEAIDGSTRPQCAIPTIHYENGVLKFFCLTDDVTYHYTLADEDICSGTGSNIILGVTYTITVYATRDGYDNSEIATATLCWIDAEPKSEGIADEVSQVRANAVLISTKDGQINISGLDDSTTVNVYTVNGMLAESVIVRNGTAIINPNLPSGSIAIVKIGSRSFKTVIK